ncbi:WD40 repeat containing protein [Ktedonobacter racemifer DSM 44963]|uniref:WD40 repeat containing protein n=2 Tax=Ktedonobacter racemifer TaxID=363277 RepID=D6TSP4_KTERA|nr:WD40 repeat containing protein [Ktedonobacter racemifer DSM 44963]
MDDKEYFNPRIVDEQIEALLQTGSHPNEETRTVHDLQGLYRSDLRSLERVWERLDLGTDTGFGKNPWTKRISQNNKPLEFERFRYMQGQHTQQDKAKSPSTFMRRFGMIAAVLFMALLVGSLIAVLNVARGQHNGPASSGNTHVTNAPNLQVKTPSGVYIGGDSGVTKIDPQTGKVIWNYTVKLDQSPVVKTPNLGITRIILSGNTLFALVGGGSSSSAQQGIIALNAQDGTVFWNKSLHTGGLTDMALGDGLVYVNAGTYSDKGSSKSDIHIFSASTGVEKRSYSFQMAITSMTWNAGKLYLGTDHGLYVTKATDGTVIWKQPVSHEQFYVTRPYIVNGVVYASFDYTSEVGGSHSDIEAYDTLSGKRLWKTGDIPGQVFDIALDKNAVYLGIQQSSPSDGNVFVGTVYSYNIQNGQKNWSKAVDGSVQSAPVVVDGVVYAPTYGGPDGNGHTTTALDASTGNQKWQKPVTLGVMLNPVAANGMIYVADCNSFDSKFSLGTKVYAYKADGTLAWQFSIAHSVSALEVAE